MMISPGKPGTLYTEMGKKENTKLMIKKDCEHDSSPCLIPSTNVTPVFPN